MMDMRLINNLANIQIDASPIEAIWESPGANLNFYESIEYEILNEG
jgi:hypothetical protein